MYTTFEATSFFREIMGSEFWVNEEIYSDKRLELIFFKHKLSKTLVSTPYRDRAAIKFHENNASIDDCFEGVKDFLKGKSAIFKDLSVFSSLSIDVSKYCNGSYSMVNSDVALDSKLESRLHKSAVKANRRAKEVFNLSFKVDSWDIDRFYELYLESRLRLGVLPYAKSLFRKFAQGIGKKTVVFSAEDESGPIGYLICYLHGDEMISGHLAYDYSKRLKRVTDFLFLQAFIWGRNNGFVNYRFGSDHRSQEGLITFKERLGAVVRPQYDLLFGVEETHDGAQNNRFVTSLIKHVPMRLFRHSFLGTKIYFS